MRKKPAGIISAMAQSKLQALLLLACSIAAQAQSLQESVVHRFKPFPFGANPYSGLLRDASGNFYGTTVNGGNYGAGVVYKVSASGQATVLHHFSGGADGGNPYATPIADSLGNLYGTAYSGGLAGYGVVYEINASDQFTVLYSFLGTPDGANPRGSLILDSEGNLYGTSVSGGTSNQGTVFELSPAGTETVLHAFTGGSDGGSPYAGLIRDADGNLYGTTYLGGHRSAHLGSGSGVVFKLDSTDAESILYTFGGGPGDGAYPSAGLAMDAQGNLYGTTTFGGFYNGGVVWSLDASGWNLLYSFRGSGSDKGGVTLDTKGNIYGADSLVGNGNGLVYRISPDGTATILHNFQGGTDGVTPYSNVVLQPDGIYGTTFYGGTANSGILYKLDSSAQESVVYTFPQGRDGSNPDGGLVSDAQGNLYGTTYYGGTAGQGVIFKLDSTGETALYSFQGGSDGANPYAGVIRDTSGNLYGTTVNGGSNGAGTVYSLSSSGTETILHNFGGSGDGANPYGGLLRDAKGNLYGTALKGGATNNGVVFKLDTSGNESVLYSFTGGADGGAPYSGLIFDSAGNLYGTTSAGGFNNVGAVYKVSPTTGNETVIYGFSGGGDGNDCRAALAMDAAGNLYGTTLTGGRSGKGVVFKIDPSGNESVLYNFTGGADGSSPYSPVVLGYHGNLYGTTSSGGSANAGVAYKLDSAGTETVLYSFAGGLDGGNPYSGLLATPAGVLYGTAYGSGAGVVYELKAVAGTP